MYPYQVTEYALTAPVKLKIAVVADLHNQCGLDAAEAVLATSPDLIFIVGDFFETPPRRSYIRFEEAVKFLEKVKGIPMFYSRGNHDYMLPNEVKAVMEDCGVTVLLDDSVSYAGIHIGGLNSAQFVKGKMPNLHFLNEFAKKEGYKLLLCHHPEYIRHIPVSIDLTIAGHAHGGQWRPFGLGIFSPGQGIFPKYTAGYYEKEKLLVSRGMKVKTPPVPRLWNTPELVLLSLSPQ